MSNERTVSIDVVFERDGKHSVLLDASKPSARNAPARVAKQLAFALRVKQELERDELGGLTEAAEKYRVTRARMSQLLNLTLLAPDIQQAVMGLTAVEAGKRVTERSLRAVVKVLDWKEQRRRWQTLLGSDSPASWSNNGNNGVGR